MPVYSKSHLDKTARFAAREFRDNQNPDENYRASKAKVEYWEIHILGDYAKMMVFLDSGHILNVEL